jgi:nitroreductase
LRTTGAGRGVRLSDRRPERKDMLEILRKRRSIRQFKKDRIAPAQVDALKEAVLRAPSSRAIKPWKFWFVQDADLIGKLARCKEHGSAFLKAAPLAVVVCGDETVSDVWIEDCSIAAIIVHLAAVGLGLGGCWIQIRNRMHSADTTHSGSWPSSPSVFPIGPLRAILSRASTGTR